MTRRNPWGLLLSFGLILTASAYMGQASVRPTQAQAFSSVPVIPVATVNGATPDASGNVTIPGPDLSAYATNSALNALAATIPPTSFVSPTTMTVDALHTAYPPSATYVGKYARVSNLYGSVDEVMRCSFDGTTYYWRPQREDYAISLTTTGGSMSITPLVTAPIVIINGTLLSNSTINLSAVRAYPGMTFTMVNKSTLGLFSMIVTGLLGSGTVPLLSGGTRTFTYTSGGWQAN